MKDAIEEVGVRYLVHFTQADNLESILENGLLPISEILSKGILAKSNDALRLDNCENATCVSIEFPNYKLLYRFMLSDNDVDWVVLVLNPKLLFIKECAFCYLNAASNEIRNIPLRERKKVSAFERMYDEFPGKPSRATLGIPKTFPTHPQAEVLIFGEIETEHIGAVVFKDEISKIKYQHLIPKELKIFTKPSFFGRRQDWTHW